MNNFITRVDALQAKPEFLNENNEDKEKALYAKGWNACNKEYINNLLNIPAADARAVPPGGIGEMSDGYHTFNGLYYQRMVLFAALVKQNKDSAWKSHRHEDGELCFGGGWFMVGIDTPEGSYTYHYEDKDWDLFDCEELPVGKHWDGHTEDDVTRLLSLPEVRPVKRGEWMMRVDSVFNGERFVEWFCSECGYVRNRGWRHTNDGKDPDAKFCENCGAKMVDAVE